MEHSIIANYAEAQAGNAEAKDWENHSFDELTTDIKPVAMIDIGAINITGLVSDSKPYAIKAWAQVKSEGAYGENFPHFNQLSHAIQELLGKLESQIMKPIEEVVLSFSGIYLQLETITFQCSLPSNGMNKQAIWEWLNKVWINHTLACQGLKPDAKQQNSSGKDAQISGKFLLHALPQAVYIDRKKCDDFSSLPPHHYHHGRQLSVTLNMVQMKKHVADNLHNLFQLVDVKLKKIVASPYADFLSLKEMMVLDKELVLCHIGANRVTASYFEDGMLQHIRTTQLGSNDVTKDVMEAFAIDWQKAEELKCEKGFVLVSEENMLVKVRSPSQYTKKIVEGKNMGADMTALLPRIITPRVEEIFECTRNLVNDLPKSSLIVLVGAGTQLPGIVSVARNYLQRRVLLAPYQLAKHALDEYSERFMGDMADTEMQSDVITGLGMMHFMNIADKELDVEPYS